MRQAQVHSTSDNLGANQGGRRTRELDAYVGVSGTKCLDPHGQNMRRQRWWAADSDAPNTGVAQFEGQLTQVGHILVDTRSFGIQNFRLRSRVESPANTFEQRKSEPQFRVF